MDKLQLIKSERFGEVEADIYSNGEDMFMTISQLAGCLEYADKKQVETLIDRNPYLKGSEFSFIQKVPLKTRGTQNTRTFTEDGIYEVTMLSNQPKAKEFRAWIRSVLKALRRGEMKMKVEADPMKRELAEAKLNNSRARVSSMWLKIASMVPVAEYKEVCASYASNILAGREVIPLPEATERLYTATEVGAMLGLDKSKVGHLANVNGMKSREYGKMVWDKSPYSAKQVQTFMYNTKAVEQFHKLLGREPQ